jgi:hypothetical protein
VLHSTFRHLPLARARDEGITLRGKFREATYWELVGPNLIPGEGDAAGWVDEKIVCIDGLLKVGVTSYSNEVVSAHCSRAYYPSCSWLTMIRSRAPRGLGDI